MSTQKHVYNLHLKQKSVIVTIKKKNVTCDFENGSVTKIV